MATFFYACIELHGARGNAYDILHAAMEGAGWKRTKNEGGVKLHLPQATYVKDIEGSSAPDVHLIVSALVDALGVSRTDPATILVIKSAGSSKLRGKAVDT